MTGSFDLAFQATCHAKGHVVDRRIGQLPHEFPVDGQRLLRTTFRLEELGGVDEKLNVVGIDPTSSFEPA